MVQTPGLALLSGIVAGIRALIARDGILRAGVHRD